MAEGSVKVSNGKWRWKCMQMDIISSWTKEWMRWGISCFTTNNKDGTRSRSNSTLSVFVTIRDLGIKGRGIILNGTWIESSSTMSGVENVTGWVSDGRIGEGGTEYKIEITRNSNGGTYLKSRRRRQSVRTWRETGVGMRELPLEENPDSPPEPVESPAVLKWKTLK